MAKTFKHPFTGKKVTIGDDALDLVGAQEIEERYGINRMQLFRLLDDLPAPVAELGLGRVWNGEEIDERINELRAQGRIKANGVLVPWRYASPGA